MTVDKESQRYLIDLPWVGTCEPVTWANGAHAAIHSILAALQHNRGAEAWLKVAARQLAEARRELKGQNRS